MADYIPWDEREDAQFSELAGTTITAIEGLTAGSDSVKFTLSDGRRYAMFHSQDCCESVEIESIVGDVRDLIGSPVLHAEVSTSESTPPGVTQEYEPESQTWTFYKLATGRGWVDIRWFGSSNGYYSESVDFVLLKADPGATP